MHTVFLWGMLIPVTVWCASAPRGAAPAHLEYLAEVWDTDRGLPDYAVNAFVQTPDGYLWMATFEGLVRFDGVRFDVTKHATHAEFPGNAVSALFLDRRGRLWAATDNGVACLFRGKWLTYGEASGEPIRFSTALFEDRDGSLLATTSERLFRLAEDHFVALPVPAGTESLRGFTSRNGDLWIHAKKYLARFQNGNWQSIPLPADIAAGELQGAGASGDGGVWLAGATNIEKFRDGAWSKPIQVPKGFRFNRNVSFLEDSGINLWVGDTSMGVLQFRPDGRVLHFSREDGLPNPAIRALFEDREKNIWVGTHGGGMARLRPRAVHLFDEGDGLGEIMLDSVSENSAGSLMVATYGGGLVQFDESRMRFTSPVDHPGFQKLGVNSVVMSVLEDRSGSIWAGVNGKGVFRIRGATVEQAIPPAPGASAPKVLFQDSRGTMWIGTESGVTSYQAGKLTFHRAESGLPAGFISAVAEDSQGEIWAGGQAGLFHVQGGQLQKFLPAGSQAYGTVSSLYAGKSGALWIGTEGGLDRLRNGSLNNYGPAQGLPPARITSIVEDDHGRLWMGTFQHGLLCVPIESFDAVAAHRTPKLDLIWLKKEDGLGTNQFRAGYQPTAWKARDGRLWFATLKGLAMADPTRIARNSVVPAVLIEAVGVSGRRIPVDESAPGILTLPEGSRRLQFFYTALSFTAPERIRFQYQLEGLEANWLDASERSASFGELRPGGYVFRVRAANNDGLWNPVPAVLAVRVAPFLWETWWFRALALGLLATVTAIVVYSFQRKQLLLKTEQLRKEQTLREDVERLQTVLKVSEERFSKAFDASPFPLSIATLDEGRFVNVNESFLESTGLQREEAIGRTRAELGLWQDPKPHAEFRTAIECEGRVRGMDVHMRDRSGHVHHLIVAAEVIELEGVRYLLSASNDITDRKHLEEQLNQAQKLESVGRLAGGVAHDFNNLLTVINGYSELLLADSDMDGLNQERVQQIRKAGERAAKLTQQLLAFSRKQVIRPQTLNLNTLVRETETMLRRLLPETIEMVTRLEPVLGLVLADPGQMHQVLLNLALNARDAMPEGGQLIMETANTELDEQYCASHPEATPGPCVLLAVTDNGVGMAEPVRRHIFEPFFTTKAASTGTGLGLATVYGIVRQSRGWIWVDSELGKGTSFKIYLPRGPSEASHEDRGTPAPRTLEATETVLLVEDQKDVRSLAKEVLESCGYRVLEAVNGAEALELAARYSGPIHLLLTDVVMPGMTGKDLSERLTALRRGIRVLYMSGYGENVIAHQGVLKPGIAFVPKPLTPHELMTKVRETLDLPST